MIQLPRLYPILDAGFFPNAQGLCAAAEELVAGGCTLMQYRNKSGNAREMLEQARALKRLFASQNQNLHFSQNQGEMGHPLHLGFSQNQKEMGHPLSVRLIMNDRADLCVAAEFDGVHVGQEDLSPEAVRWILSRGEAGPDRWLGVSTHNPDQLREADLTSADYLAIGPVFATSSKEKPDPVVGLEGVRRARTLTRKPLVAIGGITRANAASVIEAGADSVAVISDLLRDPRKSAEEFFRILR
jgi:thiamine-phosphate pyrophosphorylase